MGSSRPSGLCAVYATEAPPPAFAVSFYLAGPNGANGSIHGDCDGDGWRQEALRLLASRGFDGVVFVPESRSPRCAVTLESLVAWEEEALRHCDLILMWLPEAALCDFRTVEQWGLLQRSGKLVLGTTERDGALIKAAEKRRIPVARSLAELLTMGQQFSRPGVLRRGGERSIPLHLWRSPSFQSWLRALSQAGHRLDGIDVEWTHRSRGVGRPPFLWAMRPRIQVRGERRQLTGEVVIGRADVSAAVLYYQPLDGNLLATQVVVVREFRAAVRNRGGFAWMLPSGSGARAGEHTYDPRVTAIAEVFEETGLRLPIEQIEPVAIGDRQLLASLASHHAQLFRAALTEAQLAAVQATAAAGKPLGASPSERCYVAVRTVGELLGDADLDWSHLGMILYALQDVAAAVAERLP